MTRVLLTSDDDELEQRLREVFAATLNGELRRCPASGLASDPAGNLQRLLEAEQPEVVVFGSDVAARTAFGLAQRLDRERPDIGVVLVAPRTQEVLEQALRVGVRAVVPPAATSTEWRDAVEHALETAAHRRSRLGTGDAAAPSNHVVVVCSPKGGSGKTTVCVNLAVALAREEPGSTVLVDLDLQFGDVASALRLLPEATWTDVTRAGRLDVTSLKVFLTRHSSGLYALCSPEEPADGELVSVEQVLQVLSLLASEFRNVVVDTAAGLDEHALAALEAATDVVFVCTMDVPSVRSLRKEITALDRLGTSDARRHFVLNRADARVGLAVEDVEATVGLPVDVAVPSSRSVPLAMNQGVAIVESEPRSGAARALSDLAARFTRQPPRRAGLWRRRKEQR